MQIRTHPAADQEAIEAASYYRRSSRAAGDAFSSEFRAVLDLVRDSPTIGSPHVLGCRRKPFPRFPYSLVYTVEDDVVTVVAVSHHRRHPLYWADRIKE